MESQSYVIRGATEGRERLRILARVMRPTTLSLIDRAGIAQGTACLDVGCGGGDVTLELADVHDTVGEAIFDVAYARFVLTHLSDPAAALASP